MDTGVGVGRGGGEGNMKHLSTVLLKNENYTVSTA